METRTEEFKIGGMSCGHCIEAVKRALKQTEGVEIREVSLGTATVEYDPQVTDSETIAAAIEDAGYDVVR
jgi:copper chaperone CopZ